MKLYLGIHELSEEKFHEFEISMKRIEDAFKKWKLKHHPDKGGSSDRYQSMVDLYEKLREAVKSARDKLSIDSIVKKDFVHRYKLAAAFKRRLCFEQRLKAMVEASNLRTVVIENIGKLLKFDHSLYDQPLDEIEKAFLEYAIHPRACFFEPVGVLIAETMHAFLQPVLFECRAGVHIVTTANQDTKSRLVVERVAILIRELNGAKEFIVTTLLERNQLSEQIHHLQLRLNELEDHARASDTRVSQIGEVFQRIKAVFSDFGCLCISGLGLSAQDSANPEGLPARIREWLNSSKGERDGMEAERDAAQQERDVARREREDALRERDNALRECHAARGERDA